jgi:H+/Cl- antiporter ClcA
LAVVLPVSPACLAGMGFVAVFAGATKCPLTCILLGMELFGWFTAPFLVLSCGMAYLLSGKKSIYRK